MNTSPAPRYPKSNTLEDLAQIKADLREQIVLKKNNIEQLSTEIFSPLSSVSTGFSLLKNLKTGMAIFNGVLLGIKIMRKFKRFFHRNR